MQSRTRQSVRSLSRVHQLSEREVLTVFSSHPNLVHKNTKSRTMSSVRCSRVHSEVKNSFFIYKQYAIYKQRASGEALIPTVIRTLQPALPKGLKGFHEKAHPELKSTIRAQTRTYQSRIH